MNSKARILLFTFFALIIHSCTTGQSNDPYAKLRIGDPPPEPIGKNVDIVKVVTKKKGRLGYACHLISADEMSQALGMTPQDIKLSNATPRDADPNQTACFYKWDDPEVVSAGIFIQLLRNPLGDDFPDYIVEFIKQKRSRGEQEANGDAIFLKEMDWGDDGAYSTELAKYYWRLGEEVILSIAFNTSYSEREQYQIATKIATTLTRNYIEK